MQNEASRHQTFSSLPNFIRFMQNCFLVDTHCLIWQFQTHHVKLTLRLYVWTSPYIGQFGSNHATERRRIGPDGCLCCSDNASQDGDSVAPKVCNFWNNALEWENRFTGPNAAKISNHIKKYFNQKLSKSKFSTKTSQSAYVYLPQ